MSRSYESRRRSETMRAPRPVETPATEACSVYRQIWRRCDGGKERRFEVLALDDEMAIQMGERRLVDRYNEAGVWVNEGNRVGERLSSVVTAILTNEADAETALRETTFRERCEADDPGGERLAP